jgi:hypothetical protein
MTDVLTVTQVVNTITTEDGDTTTVSSPAVTITGLAAQGPDGPPGPAGATTLACTAGEDVSGNRMVTYDALSAVVYASSASASAHAVLGMTLGAALAGAAVSVQTYGKVVEPSWSWTALAPVYLGTDGALSQTPPITGYCVRLGFALDAHTLMLAIEPALKLA